MGAEGVMSASRAWESLDLYVSEQMTLGGSFWLASA